MTPAPIGSLELQELRERERQAALKELVGIAAATLSTIRSIERCLLQLLPPAGSQLERAQGKEGP